jgi:hypothetical protein
MELQLGGLQLNNNILHTCFKQFPFFLKIVGPADGSEYVMDYYGPRLFHVTQNNETVFQHV